MKDIVLETLRRELKKKQKQIDRLETLMTEKHVLRETAQAMDEFAHRFNNATTGKEKLKVANEWKETNDLFKKQCANAKHQNENYMKWMNKQFELQREAYELCSEIEIKAIRESLCNRTKPRPIVRKETK